MRIVNKKKFVTRILEILVIIGTIILTPLAIKYATIERGYEAVGGEYLIPLVGLVVILIIEIILEEREKIKMENEKIENKVILTLDEYLKMRDTKINQDKNISELLNLLFNCAELNRDKTDLKIETYHLREERMKILLKEVDPERYQKLLETLKQEEDED